MTQRESLDALEMVREFVQDELCARECSFLPESTDPEQGYIGSAEAALNAIEALIEDHPLIVAERRAEAGREDREAMETGADRCPPRE